MPDNRDVKVNLTTTLTLLVFGGLYSDTLFLNFASSRKNIFTCLKLLCFLDSDFFCYSQARFSH